MHWFYADGERQMGPFAEDEFAKLVVAGTVGPDTLVWNATLSQWIPHRELASAGPTPAASAPPAVPVVPDGQLQCSQCGRFFPASDVLRFEDRLICAECKPLFFQRLKEGGAAAVAALHYAGFWIRVGAKFIDGLFLLIVCLPIILLAFWLSFRGATNRSPEAVVNFFQLGFQLLSMVVGFAYETFFVGRYGATLGKMALKLKVVRANGDRVTYLRAFARSAAEIISGTVCYIGYIIVGFDAQKRALHDWVCDTRVIYRRG